MVSLAWHKDKWEMGNQLAWLCATVKSFYLLAPLWQSQAQEHETNTKQKGRVTSAWLGSPQRR